MTAFPIGSVSSTRVYFSGLLQKVLGLFWSAEDNQESAVGDAIARRAARYLITVGPVAVVARFAEAPMRR